MRELVGGKNTIGRTTAVLKKSHNTTFKPLNLNGETGRSMSLKNSVTPPGIDPGTVRLVAQLDPGNIL